MLPEGEPSLKRGSVEKLIYGVAHLSFSKRRSSKRKCTSVHGEDHGIVGDWAV